MDLVKVKCANCDALLGSVTNQWTQIGKRYLTSTLRFGALRNFAIKTAGASSIGGAGTLIEDCELQKATCQSCDADLGLKCLDTPEDHVLNPDQVIFRKPSVYMRQATDQRRKAEPKIEQILELKKATTPEETSEEPSPSPSPPPSAFPNLFGFDDTRSEDSVDILELQAEMEAQREDIQKISSNGMQLVAKFENSMAEVESGLQQVQATVEALRKDGQQKGSDLVMLREELQEARMKCANQVVMDRLEQQSQSTDEAVDQLRDVMEKTQGDAEHLRVDLSLREEELQQMSSRNAELERDLAETKRLAKDSAAAARSHAKRSEMLHKEVAGTKAVAEEGVAAAREYSAEVSNLRKELKQLRADLAKERSTREQSERDRERAERHRPAPVPTSTASLSSRELDILTSRISKIGNQASQVDSLQMEFELFKSRVQRLEEGEVASTGPGAGSAKRVEISQGDLDVCDLEEYSPSVHVRGLNEQKRKRPSHVGYEQEDEEIDLINLPTTGPGFTSDYYSATTTGSSSTGDGQNSSPWSSTSRGPDGVRLTKRGKVDKRSLRFKKQENTFSPKTAAKG